MRVDTKQLGNLEHQIEHTLHTLNPLVPILRQLPNMLLPQQIASFHSMLNLCTELESSLHAARSHVHTSIIQYELMENSLLKKAVNLQKPNKVGKGNVPSSDSEVKGNGYLKTEYMKRTKRFTSPFPKNKNLMGYLKNGISTGIFAGIDMASVRTGIDMKYLKSGAKLTLGHAQISGHAKAQLFQDGKLKPNLMLTAAASGSILKGSIFTELGNEYVNLRGDASVGIGVVSSEAKAIINKDEITLKAEVGAAAVQGEARVAFKIFGCTVTLTGTGELGAVGAGAEFSTKRNGIEFGGKASLIAGLGFKVNVKGFW